jgi:tellurite resistance protein TerC
MMDRFAYPSYGLATVLGFVGVKMLLVDVWHPPIRLSLAVIVGVLTVTVVLSLRSTRREPPAPSRTPAPTLVAQAQPERSS